jgi:hypothetical protein
VRIVRPLKPGQTRQTHALITAPMRSQRVWFGLLVGLSALLGLFKTL